MLYATALSRMLSISAESVCSSTSRYSVCIRDWCRPIYQLLTTGYSVSPNASRNSALVFRIRESACSGDCHKCSGCGAAKETVTFTAKNPIGARRGELVKVESETAPVLKAAAVLYVVPLVLFFSGYYLGFRLGGFGALVGGLGFALGIALVLVYDRKVVRKANIDYMITAFARKI